MEIKNTCTLEIIFEDDSKTFKETVANAILSKIDLRGSNLRGSDLRESNLSGSDISGSNLSGSKGLKYAQMSFDGFGEVGRLITLADVNRDGNPIFFCGCFSGTNEELISYIESGNVNLKESRHFARKTLLEAIKFITTKNK